MTTDDSGVAAQPGRFAGAFSCPLCGGAVDRVVAEGRDYWVAGGQSPAFRVILCERCEVAATFPALSAQELGGYYPEAYEPYGGGPSLGRLLRRQKYQQDLRVLHARTGAPRGRLLFELGCGNGEFLHVAAGAGWRASGVEPSAHGRRFAQEQFGLRIAEGSGEDFAFTEPADVICARHVLEHLVGVKPWLVRAFETGLRPGGWLFLKIPRLDSWEGRGLGGYWSGYDLPRHQYHFSKTGIVRVLREVGFTDLEVESEAIPSDLVRSIGFYGAHASPGWLKSAAAAVSRLPGPVKLVVGQAAAMALSPLGAGRMIVLARKPSP